MWHASLGGRPRARAGNDSVPAVKRGNGVLHLATVTPPIIHRVRLRVTNRQSSGNTVGSLRKRGEKIERRKRERDVEMRWATLTDQRERERERKGERGLLPRTSRCASPERKFSTNALCTLGLCRIGRTMPITVASSLSRKNCFYPGLEKYGLQFV